MKTPEVVTPPQFASRKLTWSIYDLPSLDKTIPRELMQMIDVTQQLIDDISTRYFSGIHLWVPFLCPGRFNKDINQFGAAPTAQFSLFLLSMYLITYDPPESITPPIAQDALYLHVKTLFTQIQVLKAPFTHQIQAGLLISIYEHAHGRPEIALASIGLCARMAYQIGINKQPKSLGWSVE